MECKLLLNSILLCSLLSCTFSGDETKELLEKSESFLSKVKRNSDSDKLRNQLQNLEQTALEEALKDDTSKKVFWLNIYNAYFQLVGKADSTINMEVFTQDLIPVAKQWFTFDEIEHGILRAKKSYGFDKLKVDEVDYRIHFALNCGARSCPPIAFYSYEKLEDQLEQATSLYLQTTTEIDHQRRIVKVTKLMDWFSEDFGGMENIPEIISEYLDEDVSGYQILFLPWDWTAEFQNFK